MADFSRTVADALGADDALTVGHGSSLSGGTLGASDSASADHAEAGTAHTATSSSSLGAVDAVSAVRVQTPIPAERIRVYARRPDGSHATELTDFNSLSLVIRWHDVSRWTLVTSDPDAVSIFSDKRTGIVVKRGDHTLLSGPRDHRTITQQGSSVQMTVAGPDDTVVMARTQAWPLPGDPVDDQTGADKRTGPAESVIRAYLEENAVGRLGRSLTLPASQGRGSRRNARGRFTYILELAQKVTSDDAIGWRLVQQSDRTVGFDVWEPSDLTGQTGLLSDEVGTTTDWTYVEDAPTVTRVVVAAGERNARTFRETVRAARESGWGMVAEQFADSRGINPADDTAAQEMRDEANDVLADGREVQSLRVSLPDTGAVVYGHGLRVGDLVRAYPAGLAVDDRITEAEITLDRGGEQAVLWVGPKESDPDERVERRARDLARHIARLERWA